MHTTLDHEKFDVYQQKFVEQRNCPGNGSTRDRVDSELMKETAGLLRLIVVISSTMPVVLRSSVPLAST